MTTFIIVLALSCPATKVVNTSKFAWNDFDQSEMKYAQKRCGEIYNDAPCVKRFTKYNLNQYSVVCGEKRSEKA